MSEKVLTAPRGEATPDTQKKVLTAAEQDQLDAFQREFADADIDTDAIIADEARRSEEDAKRAKVAELNQHLEDAEDRRRGLKAIYKSDLIDTMSNDDVEAFISEKLGGAENVEKIVEQKANPEILVNDKYLPHDFPTPEEAMEDVEAEGPVKLGLWKRARRLAGAPGRVVWKGYSKLLSRNEKFAERLSKMTPEEQEKYERRANVIVYLGTAAIAGAYALTRAEHLLNLLPGMDGSGNGGHHDVDPDAKPTTATISPDQLERQAHIDQFIYNPAEDPFNQPGRQGVNFSAGIDTTDPFKAKEQLLENWKHNPQQFATVMASMGMIENTPSAIEHAADMMRGDAAVYAANYDQVIAQIDDTPPQFRPGADGYGSYYAVDNGDGSQTIAYQSAVYGDPQPMIMLTANGKPLTAGCHCGQLTFIPDVQQQQAPVGAVDYQPTTPEQSVYQPASYTPPQGGGEYTPPSSPPEQPPVQPPQPPEQPPEQPPVQPPVGEGKGNAYPAPPEIVPLDSGPLREVPDAVEEFVETLPDRGVPQAPIIDNFLQPRGGETGGSGAGSAPSLDTGNNPGGGNIQAPESPSTNTTKIDSTL